jgi:hypothetical protein
MEGRAGQGGVTYSRLPPEEQQLLSRRHLILIDGGGLSRLGWVANAGLEEDEG